MATRCFFTRSLLTIKQTVSSKLCRSYTSLSLSSPPSSLSNSSLLRLSSFASVTHSHRVTSAATTTRGFAARRAPSSLSHPKPNRSNPPRRTRYYLDGCDFEHWIVMMDKPEGDPSRDELIDIYIKTLAMVVGRFDLNSSFFLM
ncbi:hypothetical protein Acr_23g0007900 [Actinidia rufa]|uniref:MORF/ORRM1/DAG-like MORF domain-containing protein n=1 Tax=Actinidia rufa TaxID=165716 RepID=A0A7J0GNP1_9ERIC|nr:hypothetical protein Acr_23g0007900 [Actinidia rufa]